MRETVVSGENVLAINIIGSYALDWVKDNTNLGAAFGTDYTAAFSRIAIITKNEPHPEEEQLFLQFLQSQNGKTALDERVGMPGVRGEVAGGLTKVSVKHVVRRAYSKE